MKPILYQGSTGTYGDLFFSSHYMYHQHTLGREIHVAVSERISPEIKDLYTRHTFLRGIHMLPDLSQESYLQYCAERGFEHNLHLIDMKYVKGTGFHPLSEWLRIDETPTIPKGCIGIHVMSTANYQRPVIPGFLEYLGAFRYVNWPVAILGSKMDEESFCQAYPTVRETIPESLWRFGKDSVMQTIANTGALFGALVFSSWVSYAAVLQKVPTIELWTDDQWLVFSPLVYHMLGCPIHYIQDSYRNVPPNMRVIDILKNLKNYITAYYGL